MYIALRYPRSIVSHYRCQRFSSSKPFLKLLRFTSAICNFEFRALFCLYAKSINYQSIDRSIDICSIIFFLEFYAQCCSLTMRKKATCTQKWIKLCATYFHFYMHLKNIKHYANFCFVHIFALRKFHAKKILFSKKRPAQSASAQDFPRSKKNALWESGTFPRLLFLFFLLCHVFFSRYTASVFIFFSPPKWSVLYLRST